MQLSVTFRHMEATDALKDYAKEKIERIKKYFPDPISGHVVLSTERGYQHCADVNIQLHNGIGIKGREITEDMYSSIDLVMAKIERQVRRYKERIREHKARVDISQVSVAISVISGEQQPETQTAAPGPTVIKTEQFMAQPLTVDEAVMQLNLLGNEFLVFRHSVSGLVNVVYKREDGNYGLIEAPGGGSTPA
jgi:putative sigma-54 modulation protein